MSPDEQKIITDLFNRLKSTASQARDAGADQLIQKLVQQQPYAPYFLVQSVIVQNQALEAANQKIQQLQSQTQSSNSGGGFLSGLFGGGQNQSQAQRPAARQPQNYAPQQQNAAPAASGGGFLRNALGTAAGVAGGVLLADSISGLFHGGSEAPAGGETIVNNYEDFSSPDQADTSDAGFYGGGFDDGGGMDI